MRQLNKEEKHFTQEGIKRLQKEIQELKEAEIVFNAREKYIKAKQEYEKIATPYNNKLEADEVVKTIKNIIDQIETKKHTINQMQSHLKNGVEEKINKLVQ